MERWSVSGPLQPELSEDLTHVPCVLRPRRSSDACYWDKKQIYVFNIQNNTEQILLVKIKIGYDLL